MCTLSQESKLISASLFLVALISAAAQPAQPDLPPLPPGLPQSTSRLQPGAQTKPLTQTPAPQLKLTVSTNSVLHPPVFSNSLIRPPMFSPPLSAKVAPLMADSFVKEYTANPGDTNAHFTFYLTNISTAPVLINAVRTSCGCTVAKLPSTPWKLEPGSNGPIQVTVDLRGKRGAIQKQVTVESDSGTRMMHVKVNIPDLSAGTMTNNLERARNMEIAKANRKAILQGECATCHVTPAIGKSGKELYVAACGICHDSDNRATSVPDLYTLAVPTDAAYWRKWITSGKADGMMPGFANAEGGPLNEEQIGSLVHYLSRNINPMPVRRSVVLPAPAARQ